MDVVKSLLDMILSFSPMIAPLMVGFSTIYAAWYITSLKTYAPMTREEAQLLWRIHKKETGCDAQKMREIKHKNKIVGIKCECGYKHVQKRPILR